MLIGKIRLDETVPHFWGILNITPDSFSDGGRFNTLDKALFHAEEMMKAGAEIIDIGGMSTRPGHEVITSQEEIERLCPVIEAVKSRMDVFVSADTYRSDVALAAAGVGVDIINDIHGLRQDVNMAKVIADKELACCLMHNNWGGYNMDFMDQVVAELRETLDIALNAGIARERIVLDPGVGFGKDTAQNLTVINQVARTAVHGLPVLLGCSRKSVIGNTLGLPSDEREEGTIATTLWGLSQNIMHFRVHDVEKNVRAARMWLAIKNA